jgi:hypothetical protein
LYNVTIRPIGEIEDGDGTTVDSGEEDSRVKLIAVHHRHGNGEKVSGEVPSAVFDLVGSTRSD